MPTQIATGVGTTALDYSPQRKLEYLCDGSLLFMYQSAANTLSLVQVTTPGGTPGTTSVSQTFSITSGTNTVGDMYILNNGTTTSDVWIVWGDNSSTTGLHVQHGVYTASGSSWAWDTATQIASTPTFMLPSIVWNGSYLIVCTRIGSYMVEIYYSSTKNGTGTWSNAQFSSTSGSTHYYAQVLHDATNSITVCVYTINGDKIVARAIADSSTPSVANWSAETALTGTIGVGAANMAAVLDAANQRVHVVYDDSTGGATDPHYVNFTYTATSISAGTPFSVSTEASTVAGVAIGLDAASPPNAWMFWSTAAVGSAADIKYVKLASTYASGNLGTVTNLTNSTSTDNAYPHVATLAPMTGGYAALVYEHAVSTWAQEYDNSVAITGGTTNVSVSDTGTGSDSASVVVSFTVAEAGTGSEGLTETGQTATPADTGTGAEGFIISVTPNTVIDSGAGVDSASVAAAFTVAETGTGVDLDTGETVTLTVADIGSGADSVTTGVPVSIADTGVGVDTPSYVLGPTPITVAETGSGVDAPAIAATFSVTDTGTGADALTVGLPFLIAESGAGVDAVAPPLAVTLTVADAGVGLDAVAVAVTCSVTDSGSGVDAPTVSSSLRTLTVSTRTQTWTGGSGGASPGTETDVLSVDANGNGAFVGMIPTYGGMDVSSHGQVTANALGTNQTALNTSTSDGKWHWLDQIPNGTFGGSEDKAWTLSELAPTGTSVRRYYKGVSNSNDANGFSWTAYVCIYPGDPMFIAIRFDLTNPTGSAIALAGADGLEVALIGGLQQADSTWAATNGYYGQVGGSATAWPTASANGNPVAADPDWAYIPPAGGGSSAIANLTVKRDRVTALSPAWSSGQLSALVNANRLKLKLSGTISSFPGSTTSTLYLLGALTSTINATIANAIAADYINPGTPTASVGTYTAFSWDERAYVMAASASRNATLTLDMSPASVSVRYAPVVKVTGYTGGAPLITWGGAPLTNGVDYQYIYDATNSILYVTLGFNVVSSGAVAGQRNNAALAIVPAAVSVPVADTGTGADSVSITVLAPVAETGVGVDLASAGLTFSIADTGVGVSALALAVALTLADAGVGVDTALAGPLATVPDTGAGVESVALAVSLTLADSGAGVDLAAVAAVVVAVADTGTGVDTPVTGQPLVVGETALAVDAITVFVTLAQADSGAGAEGVVTPVASVIADTGVAVEFLSAGFATGVTDSGVGVDATAVIMTIQEIPGGPSGVATFAGVPVAAAALAGEAVVVKSTEMD